jgi:hypothetical protein
MVNDKVLCISYVREKLPYHMFPCTRGLHDISYIHRLTYRLHNRLFLNFEIQKTMDHTELYKVYFNYNHDKSSEVSTITKPLGEVMQSLLASTC